MIRYLAQLPRSQLNKPGSLDVIVLLQASLEKKTKKQQEDAGGAMKELLEQSSSRSVKFIKKKIGKRVVWKTCFEKNSCFAILRE
jgi:hypothetical protein